MLTSAGTAAGLDVCLHLVRLDHGSRAANAVARRAVVPPHRDGGQVQFVTGPPLPTGGGGGPAAALDWARERPGEPLTVDAWAHRAGASPRTLARHFRDATGTTPLQWLADERVRWARELLEETDLPVEAVARRCGFGTAAGLRKVFARRVGTTTQAYRSAFRVEVS